MGQYYLVVNIDKKQFLYPHRFGEGLKLLEFGSGSRGILTGLAILLADGNGRGGGDLRSDNPIIGSWAGDRIVIAGDYADPCKHVDYLENIVRGLSNEDTSLYELAEKTFEDISEPVIKAMADDAFLREELKKKRRWDVATGENRPVFEG